MQKRRFLKNFNYLIKTNWVLFICLILMVIFAIMAKFIQNGYLLILSFIWMFFVIFLFYKLDQAISIAVLSSFPLFFLGSLWWTTGDVNYLTVGITSVLVIITSWYSFNMYQQVKISEKMGKKNYIAEIARSIFSAMQIDIKRVKRDLETGFYLISLNPLKTTIDGIDPQNFLNREIPIRGKRIIQSDLRISYSYNPTGAFRPATVLLTIPEEILQRKYLPEITALCQEYENNQKKLLDSLSIIVNNIPLIWDDFKKFCDDLDNYNLNDFFNQNNPFFPQETNYQLIFKIVISHSITEQKSSRDYFNERIQTFARNEDFKKYIIDYKDAIQKWLLNSQIKDNLVELDRNVNELIATIDKIDQQINDLFLDWKMEYYLTEDEMNIKEDESFI